MQNTEIKADSLDAGTVPSLPAERPRKPTGGARKPRSGVYVQTGHRVRHKRTVELAAEDEDDLPEHVPSPVSLPPITTTIITDALVGLKDDPKAQEDAEAFVKAALAYQAKQALKASQSEKEAAVMVADAKAKRQARQARLAIIREVGRKFTAKTAIPG